MKNNKKTLFTFFGCLLFLITVTAVSTISIFVYDTISTKTNNKLIIMMIIFLCIVFLSTLFIIVDFIRRKHFVEKPVNEILEATQKVMQGDLSVKLELNHRYEKFDEYDEIKQNLNDMIEELSKQELLKNDFISNVSNEIKTPLSIIQNYASALQNKKLDDKTKTEYLNTINSATKRLNNLITNILKLNKLENQVILPVSKEINLEEILSESILTFDELISAKNLKISCDIDSIKLNTDESLIEIIFNNLLSNAIKFTDNGGEIFVTLKEENSNIILTVKDTGCGMNSETGNHIFDKFYQGDTSHSSEGNGLGLALVKQVINTIGGTIAVSSTEHKGSTFTVTLKKSN